MAQNKTQRLLDVAGRTLDRGDRQTAKEMVVLAMRQEDAIHALDRLLPQVPEPQWDEEDLSEVQIAKVMTLARELQDMKKFKIANQILSKLDTIEGKRRRRPKL